MNYELIEQDGSIILRDVKQKVFKSKTEALFYIFNVYGKKDTEEAVKILFREKDVVPRGSPKIYWKRINNEFVDIEDMSEEYIHNILRMLEKRNNSMNKTIWIDILKGELNRRQI